MSKAQQYARQLMTLGRQAKQGASLGFADELQDLIGSAAAKALLEGAALTGRIDAAPTYSEILRGAREQSQGEIAQDWKEAPVTSFAGNVAGFIPFALGQAGLRATLGAAKAPAMATKAANALARLNTGLQGWAATGGRLARAGRGVAIGAGYGTASGIGAAGDTLENRTQGALLGAGIGAATGGLGGAVSRAAPTRQNVAPQAAEQAAKNPAEREFLRQLLMRPDLTDMQKRAISMQQLSKQTGIELTLPEMLAQTDVDPLLAQQAILAKSPETAGAAQSILQRRMGDPLAGQPGQINTALRGAANQLAPGSYDDLAQQLMRQGKTAAGDITKKLQEQAGPLYREAMQANKSMASPELDKILETPAGRQALAQARTILQNEGTRLGIPDKELGELARELGIRSKGGVAAGLKLQTYDLIKRGLDDMISNEISRSSPGTTSATARSLQSLRSRLVGELDRLDVTGITGPNSTRPDGGAYARARAVYSSQPEVSGNRELMGELANIDQLDPQRVVPQLYSGTPGTAQRTAQALGPEGSRAAAAAKLQDILGSLKSGSLPPRLDADTMAMLKTYAGPDADKITNLLQVVEKARAGERFLRGSQTQTNQAMQQAMDAASGVAEDIATGNKAGLIRRGVGAVTDAITGNRKEQYNLDLLNLFTTPRGMEALNDAVRLQQLGLQRVIPQAIAPRATVTSSSQLAAPRDYAPSMPTALATIPASQAAVSSQLPSGFVIRERQQLPQGFVVKGSN